MKAHADFSEFEKLKNHSTYVALKMKKLPTHGKLSSESDVGCHIIPFCFLTTVTTNSHSQLKR